ncbi:site-specific DNA-methyltransferase [Leuconostoc gelidum subsp. gasicomitatum]|uniref:DNA methyltransferase n=1 Tax=Leuconostoc gasicomitatum TaxID=115778 RepID=UPI001CC67664|nr:DNA methyltransferase [Leuconostoc gasicomitatum]MBZ5959715.1 site-specific DNA-methyltransferase [Leuconostoc gasicomitatum]MBZ5994198.1 site-specific DNA-methyltransferase [Leuconostoc gasicomitatum]
MAIFLGDALEVVSKLESNSVQVIYLDPPFFSQKRHTLSSKEGKTYDFDDHWNSLSDYTNFMTDRIVECKRVLKDSGTIFLHCDTSAAHHLRLILDNVFGTENFRSEIIWHYKRWSNSKKGLLNAHQTIYFYSKTNKYKFNKIYTDYSATTNLDQITQKRTRKDNNKSGYLQDNDGNVVLDTQKNGVPLSDVWDIPYLNPKAKERTGYPTQKPIHLLKQIINISTDEGDTVLDPFCGSGTSMVAAKLMGREYIGVDISSDAIEITNRRLLHPIESNSELLKKGIDGYKNIDPTKLSLLNYFHAKPIYRNKGLDGFINDSINNKLMGIKIQNNDESIVESFDKFNRALSKKNISTGLLVQTHDDDLKFDFDDITSEKITLIKSPDFILQEVMNRKIY